MLLLLLDEAKDPRGNELATGARSAKRETRGDVSWWAVANDPLLFDSVETSVEATAFAVQALASSAIRRNPLLERAVRWLMLNRTGGYWSSTKQTAMAIYGLLAFMQARGETAQPFSVDVFVNGAAGRPPAVHGGGDDRAGSDRHLRARQRRRQPGAAREARRRHRLLVGGGGVLRHRRARTRAAARGSWP